MIMYTQCIAGNYCQDLNLVRAGEFCTKVISWLLLLAEKQREVVVH